MYGLITYIWLKFMVNVGKYSIHGSRAQGPWFYKNHANLLLVSGMGTRKICCWIKPLCLDTPLALRIPKIQTLFCWYPSCQLLAKSPNMGFFWDYMLHEFGGWTSSFPSEGPFAFPPLLYVKLNPFHVKVRMDLPVQGLKRNPKTKNSLDNLPTTNIFLPKTGVGVNDFAKIPKVGYVTFFWKVQLSISALSHKGHHITNPNTWFWKTGKYIKHYIIWYTPRWWKVWSHLQIISLGNVFTYIFHKCHFKRLTLKKLLELDCWMSKSTSGVRTVTT